MSAPQARPARSVADEDQTRRILTGSELLGQRLRSSLSELSTAPSARYEDDVGVDDVCGAGRAEQATDRVGLGRREGDNVASAQESPQLDLRPERLTRATTGAVVTGTTPSSSRARWSAQTARSWDSTAISTPKS
jgi:hypothetical protein